MLMAMKDSPQVAENRRIAKEAAGDSRRLIIISQLAAWSDAADERLQYTLPLGLFAGFPSLDLPDDVRARLSISFRGLRANGTKTYVKEIIHCLN